MAAVACGSNACLRELVCTIVHTRVVLFISNWLHLNNTEAGPLLSCDSVPASPRSILASIAQAVVQHSPAPGGDTAAPVTPVGRYFDC